MANASQSAFDHLSRIANDPVRRFGLTIGEIDRAIKRDLRSYPDAEELWRRYDETFSARADYRIWRTLFRSANPSSLSQLWRPEAMIGLIDEELDNVASRSPSSSWAILIMTAGLLTHASSHLSSDVLLALGTAAELALLRLRPLANSARACALASALTADAIQKMRLRIFGSIDVNQAEQHLTTLSTQLQILDPAWRPGKSVHFGKEVLPFFPFNSVQLSRRVASMLYSPHFLVERALIDKTLDARGMGLLELAAKFAISSWKYSRAIRIGQEKYASENKLRCSALEMGALLAATTAARLAGNYLGNANLAYYLLRVIPDELLHLEQFANLGKRFGLVIRQAGLEVDERFILYPEIVSGLLVPIKDNRAVYRRDIPGDIEAESCVETPISDPEWPKAYLGEGNRVLAARLRLEQGVDPDWATVLRVEGLRDECTSDPGWGFGVLRWIVDQQEGGREFEPSLLRSAFRLNLRHGRIHDAAKLLKAFRPGKSDLREFINWVRQVVWMAPFGVDLNKYAEWQTILQSRLDQPLLLFEEWSWLELVSLHEVLVGFGQSIIQAAPPEGRRIFTQRLYMRLSAEESREVTHGSRLAVARGPEPLKIFDVVDAHHRLQTNGFGQPVLVSLISTGNNHNHLSLISIDQSGRRRKSVITIPGLHAAVQRIRQSLHGLRVLHDVYWPAPVRGLAHEIAAQALMPVDRPQLLLLAVEPWLAALPWQNLMMREQENIVVSLVPSISWALQGADSTKTSSGIGCPSIFRMSSASDLVALKRVVQGSSLLTLGARCSIAVVVGHGQERASNLPAISATASGSELLFEHWLDIATRRIVVVHSCFGASTTRAFLGDFGGLPGLALGLGCRIFCAPVAEMPVTAAMVLHECLCDDSKDHPEFGMRYLKAIRRDEAVNLYNLYGYPTEAVV